MDGESLKIWKGSVGGWKKHVPGGQQYNEMLSSSQHCGHWEQRHSCREARGGCGVLCHPALFHWHRVSHWAWRLLFFSLAKVSSIPESLLCPPTPKLGSWICTFGFYVGARDLNSHLHVCSVSTLTPEDISPGLGTCSSSPSSSSSYYYYYRLGIRILYIPEVNFWIIGNSQN